jgi:Ca2+-transporting ATPase
VHSLTVLRHGAYHDRSLAIVNARSDERSAFQRLFTNLWLWAAMAASVALQVAVVHASFLQRAFGTASLGAADWLFCAAVASSVLWLRELSKVMSRVRSTR